MQVSDQNPKDKPEGGPDFAQEYVDEMLNLIVKYRHWSPVDFMFRDCPKEELANVAFIFLHHYEHDGSRYPH